jgi:hypothetical protein
MTQETFMKVISVGAGLGAGVEDSRVIFAFEDEQRSHNPSIPAGKSPRRLNCCYSKNEHAWRPISSKRKVLARVRSVVVVN